MIPSAESACVKLTDDTGVVTIERTTAARLEGDVTVATAQGLGYFTMCKTCEAEICFQPGEPLICRIDP